MSEERSGKSHALAWALSVLAVPVLYVLSAPAIYYSFAPQSDWVVKYARPYHDLTMALNGTFAMRYLGAYDLWCWDRFHRGP